MKSSLSELEVLLQSLQVIPRKHKKQGDEKTCYAFSVNTELDNVIKSDSGSKGEQAQHSGRYETETQKYLLIIENLKNKLKEVTEENSILREQEKRMRSIIVESKGLIQVFGRVKPQSTKTGVYYTDKQIVLSSKAFSFDKIFSENDNQEAVYSEFRPLIEHVLEGYNVCIFAYGQTGSGKTYTMGGDVNETGLIQNSIECLKTKLALQAKETTTQKLTIQYFEIYNNEIRDLIGGTAVSIQHTRNGSTVPESTEKQIKNLDCALDVLNSAIGRRRTGKTECNSQSSRSHAVFAINIHTVKNDIVHKGSLVLIDLAGSERLSKSKAANERLAETQHINKSLSTLGNVFNAIKRKDKFVPYRESKLTDLLSKYFSEKSRTVMIANLNLENSDETLCTLRFATKVSECELGENKKNISKEI
ncbi:kinesin family member C1 [Enteropsectra breve]|nr:kinesin family member C1 [Enteropsectra breve]